MQIMVGPAGFQWAGKSARWLSADPDRTEISNLVSTLRVIRDGAIFDTGEMRRLDGDALTQFYGLQRVCGTPYNQALIAARFALGDKIDIDLPDNISPADIWTALTKPLGAFPQMAMSDLIRGVVATLEHRNAVIIDDDTFYSANSDMLFTFDSARVLAEGLILDGAVRYATAEKFQRSDTNEVYIAVIASNSIEGWRESCRELQQQIARDISKTCEITTRVVIEHVIDVSHRPC